jgi:uncharacterized PurR-regulated membrane protein YhhQ (DUF165 family)
LLSQNEVKDLIDSIVDQYDDKRRFANMDKKWLFAIGYMLSIVFANFCVAWWGLVTWFGWLTFPAGAIFIGLTFSMRDFVQREWGHVKVWWFMLITTVITVLMGVALSHLPIPLWKVALASGVAFIVSEAIDWAVYYFLKKDIIWRICVSNIFSTPIDSILFVGIAFGSFSFLAPPVWGQTIVKYISGLLVIPILLYFRNKSQSPVQETA